MRRTRKYPLENTFNKKTDKAFNLFWAGIIINTVCYSLMISGAVPPKITYLQLIGIALFVFAATRLIRFKIENAYLRNIYIVYCCWLLYTVSRGFTFSSKYLFDTLIDDTFGVFVYLVPLILLFPKDLIYLKKLIKVIVILSVFQVLFDMAFIKALLDPDSENGHSILENFARNLGIPCGFVLFTMTYHIDKKKNRALMGRVWFLFVIMLTFLLAVIRARRGLMFMTVNILLFTYIIYNYANKSNLFFKFFPLIIIFFLYVYASNKFDEKKPGALSALTEHLNEDTRSGVVDYFYRDMNKKEWIVGKGINGQYYCPSGATEDGFRGVIESDYLQIILKGGMISLGLLSLIAIPAILKGFFYSKNILSKAAATWILLWLVALFPATVTTFSLNYMLVWISIGICYSKKIRNMDEDSVKEHFHYTLFKRK
jgi:hypothetical protein